jgi:menaquinone-9 beta-reductase
MGRDGRTMHAHEETTMTPAPRRSRYDAVVVGARCAGAATALRLAQLGRSVLVIERDQYGADTLSTLAIMRGGVMQLARWGVLDRLHAAGTPVIRTVSFHYAGDGVEIPIKPRDGVDGLCAPRRTRLDAALVDAARAAGAEVVHGTRLLDLTRARAGRVNGVVVEGRGGARREVAASLVIGADGVRSTTARLTGAEAYHVGRHAGAVVYGFWSGLEAKGLEWHYTGEVSAGIIPTDEGQTLVFAAVTPSRFLRERTGGLEGVHARVLGEVSPELAARVRRGELVGRLHGFAGQPGYFRRAWGPGWALVGDAGYFKDPITAHGITDALCHAELLARAAARATDEALASYQEERDALSMGLFEVTDEIASLDWDMDGLRALHLRLSEEMNREVRRFSSLEPVAAPAAGDVPPPSTTGETTQPTSAAPSRFPHQARLAIGQAPAGQRS